MLQQYRPWIVIGLVFFVIILFYPEKFRWLSWNNWRGLEMFLLALTALGVILAFFTYRGNIERQKMVDLSSISINPASDPTKSINGVFSVINTGEVTITIKLEIATLNDGTEPHKWKEENNNPTYREIFEGNINPKQSIDFHTFDISAEKLFVYRGAIKTTVNNQQFMITKIRYAGEAAQKVYTIGQLTHPHKTWTIYSQKIYDKTSR